MIYLYFISTVDGDLVKIHQQGAKEFNLMPCSIGLLFKVQDIGGILESDSFFILLPRLDLGDLCRNHCAVREYC